jgi:hypothetical protein
MMAAAAITEADEPPPLAAQVAKLCNNLISRSVFDGHAVDYDPVYCERLPKDCGRGATIYPTDNFDRTQNAERLGKRWSERLGCGPVPP